MRRVGRLARPRTPSLSPYAGRGWDRPEDDVVKLGRQDALLESLWFARLCDDRHHALYRSLARIPLSIFDILCGLYCTSSTSTRVYPMLSTHAPTSKPQSTLGQLLLIILGLGAIDAPVPGALQLGRMLMEVARGGTEHLINRDNCLARSFPIATRSSGSSLLDSL